MSTVLVIATLLVAVTFLFLGSIAYIALSTRALKLNFNRLLELNVTQQRSIGQLETALHTLRLYVNSTQQNLTRFTEESLALKSELRAQSAFEEASRLLREGHAPDTLRDSCGLNAREAELMVKIHRHPETGPTQNEHTGSDSSANGSPASNREEDRLRNLLKAASG